MGWGRKKTFLSSFGFGEILLNKVYPPYFTIFSLQQELRIAIF
jgi:hypothetical protein